MASKKTPSDRSLIPDTCPFCAHGAFVREDSHGFAVHCGTCGARGSSVQFPSTWTTPDGKVIKAAISASRRRRDKIPDTLCSLNYVMMQMAVARWNNRTQ